MADLTAPTYASEVDYEKYGRYASSDKLDDARSRGARDASSAFEKLSLFRNRLSDDGSARFPAESGRYHLYLAAGCPFCHRVLIALRLLGLERAVSFSFVDDERDGRGWAFRARRGPDPVNGFAFLREAYVATDPAFDGHVSAPVLWDRRTKTIVNNDSGDILIDLASRFKDLADLAYDLYPERLRGELDAFDARLQADVNFGVYAVGLSKSQAEYDVAVKRVFDALDRLEQRLGASRFLFGDELTESDIRLWATLARFDVGYFTSFKVNLKRLVDYPNLWAYARDLYRIPAFREFTDFDRYKADYIRNFPALDPSGVIPIGPIADWDEEPDRARLTRAL